MAHFISRLLLISLILSAISFISCADEIKVTTRDGAVRNQKVSKELKLLNFSSDNTKSIENLDRLQNLVELDFYHEAFITDYSFIKNIKSLKILRISFGYINDLSFLKSLPNIEILSLEMCYFNKSVYVIDLKGLEKLRYIGLVNCIIDKNAKLQKMPFFTNVQNKPVLNLFGNAIAQMSKDELNGLRQFSKVLLASNPIAKDSTEFEDYPVVFNGSELPEEFQKYLP